MRRVGKGFSGVDTLLFEGMLVPQVQDDIDVADDIVNVVDVAAADAEPTPPSPTPAITPPPPQPKVSSTPPLSPHQSPIAHPSSPPPQQPSQPLHTTYISMDLLNTLLETCTTLTRRVENLEQDKIAQALKITKLKQRVRSLEQKRKGCIQTGGGEIAKLDADEDDTLEEVAAEVPKDAEVQGRLEESQAQVYHLDLEHADKVLTTLSVVVYSKPKSKDKGKGILVEEPKPLKKQAQIEQDEAYARELEAELNANINWNEVIEQVKRKEKQDNAVLRYEALKRKPQTKAQARKNMMVYLKNIARLKMDFFKGMSYDDIRPIFEKHFNSIVAFLEKREEELEEEASKQSKRKSKSSEEKVAKKQKLDEEVDELKAYLQIVPNDENDVYTEATPLALKVPVVDYQIHTKHNKPFYKIIRADGTHQLFLSFISLLRNFDREDLEMLWQIPNVEAHVWKSQRGSYGLAKVESWKLLESCGVHIITFTTTQMILLVERRYPLTRFTLDQMLNNVRLEVEEESEVSLELLRFIIMENIPPPNNNPNDLEKEPILDQAPAALVGFTPQWIGEQIPDNNNSWLEEDSEEEPKEEEENEAMVNDEEDDAEIADTDDVPIPHVIQFGSNFHVGERSASRDLFVGNSKVCAPGPMCCDLKSVHRGVKRLSTQMHDKYKMEKKMAKKLRQDELRLNGQEFDITTLDSAVIENRSKNSKMIRLITGLSREFIELKNQNRRAEELNDPYVMVRNAALDIGGDEDVDTDAPRDTQPSEPRGSPRNSQIMPPKKRSQTNPQPTLTQKDVDQLMRDGIEAAIRDEQERVRREATRAGGPLGGPVTAQKEPYDPRKNKFLYKFMKCGPTQFHRTEGVVGFIRWFEKMMNTFEITAYTERFNELALLCLDAVPNEKKKVKLYIKGLPEIIKGETTSSRPATLNEAMRMAHALMEQKIQAKNERIAEGANQTGVSPKYNRCERCHFDQYPSKCENCGRIGHKAKDCQSRNVASGAAVQPNVVCYRCGERGHKSFECPKKADRRGGNVQGQAYVIRDAEHNQGPNVVTDIIPFKLNSSYEVELADEKVVSTNSVLRGCTLNLLDHLFDIDLMPIELGTFDVIVGMDWLVECDALIVCGRMKVHVPYKNKTLVVKSDSNKQLQDVPVICNFPEVFPDDLPGLPPPRQVEFKIKLIPGAAPIARAPYRLAPSELKELSDQLTNCLRRDLYARVLHPRELRRRYPITAFQTMYGHFEFQVMPFGLTNAPAVFMDLMNRVCKPYLDKFVIVFIDDILIYSKNKEDHEEHLKTILELLKNEKFNDVHVDHAKVEAIRNWSAPTTPTEKNKKYEWSMEEEEAFQTLKQKLCSAPILALPEGTKNFIVYCDASLKGYGAVLMQREKKELNMRQRRWIELLSDYDCEIRYHPGKGNVVADALSQKDIEPLRVRSLVMTVHTNLPEKILEAQTEAMKEENVKAENLERLLKPIFEIRSIGIRYFKGRL
nr:hypothetical protein [Tanacetum cinerariifolium]